MEALKKLFESALLNDESRVALKEAFDTAVAAKEVELQAKFESQLAESESQILEQLPNLIESAVAEELAAIAEEVATARNLELEYAQKLTTFKESYAQRQEELARVQIAEAVAEEIEAIRADIEEAKRHEFGMKMFETFSGVYAAMFGGDVSASELRESLAATRAELEAIKREQKVAELVESLSGEKRAVALTILEGVAFDDLEAKFESVRPVLLGESKKGKAKCESEEADEQEADEQEGEDVQKQPAAKKVVAEGLDDAAQRIIAEKLERSLKLAKR